MYCPSINIDNQIKYNSTFSSLVNPKNKDTLFYFKKLYIDTLKFSARDAQNETLIARDKERKL